MMRGCMVEDVWWRVYGVNDEGVYGGGCVAEDVRWWVYGGGCMVVDVPVDDNVWIQAFDRLRPKFLVEGMSLGELCASTRQ
jgi:hypothetical protein